jgi:uncharacterized protein YjiK
MFGYRGLYLLLLLFTVRLSYPKALFSQSIAAMLSQFEKTFQKAIPDVNVINFSGITLNIATGTLFVIDDEGGFIFEISTAGEVIRPIFLNNFNDSDPEGIAYTSDGVFYITEERQANLVRIEIPEGRPIDREDCLVFSIADSMGNTGLEGLAYRANENKLYALKEFYPYAIYQVDLNNLGEPEKSTANSPFIMKGIDGDAAGIYALADGAFLICSQTMNTLYGFSESGDILSELSLEMNQPEGVTFDPADSTIYIIGEPTQFAVFKRKTLSVNSNKIKECTNYNFTVHQTSNDLLVIQFHRSLISPTRIGLYTLNGRKIVGHSVHSDLRQFIVSTGDIHPGAYCLTIEIGTLSYVKQFVVK